jgi:UDP-N-acetyl-D-mannosaminuronic acid transferase (WecB/TagA/CpsF family)
LYGTYPDLLAKTKVFLEKKWYQVVYAQDGYTNLDWNQVEKSLPHQEGTINVLLVARVTPIYPIQDIRSYANKEQIKKYHLLTMNQWWTFDWRVGKQKRPPRIIIYLRLERLRRLISDPKRNYKKVLDSLGIFRYIFYYLLLKKGSS